MFSSLYWSAPNLSDFANFSTSFEELPESSTPKENPEALGSSPLESAASELDKQLRCSCEQLQSSQLRRAHSYYLYFDSFPSMKQTDETSDIDLASARLQKAGKVSRLCDLYLDGGQALQGYRPAGVTNQLKNIMSRGLYAGLPSRRSEMRLTSLLQRLFPRVQDFRLYHNLTNLEKCCHSFSTVELLCCGQSNGVMLWRPLSPEALENLAKFHLIVPVLALSSLPLPYLVLRFDVATSSPTKPIANLPSSDICSPLQIEALVQALGQTERLLTGQPNSVGFYSKAVQQLRHNAMQTGLWREDGIYLYWQGHNSQGYHRYATFWQQAWQRGFLLPPNPWAPVIIPPLWPDNPPNASSKKHNGLSNEYLKLQNLLTLARSRT